MREQVYHYDFLSFLYGGKTQWILQRLKEDRFILFKVLPLPEDIRILEVDVARDRLYLLTNHGIIVTLRLHNDKSDFATMSFKFDVSIEKMHSVFESFIVGKDGVSKKFRISKNQLTIPFLS
jgi:hypothetical protein